MKRSMKITGPTIAVMVLLGTVAGSYGAYVLTPSGQRVDGSDIRAKSDGEIILTTPQGTRSFLKGQYAKAVADKPADMDKAVQLVAAKQYDEAIKLLEDVAVRYHFLDWDNQARAMLPKIYIQKGDFASAISSYEKLFALSPKSKEDIEIQMSYRQALLDAKQYDKLEALLNSVIGAGTRSDAARAFLMRGDIRASQGQAEQAVLDYLRVVLLFEGEKDVQPEALFKTTEALKALRDPRAPEFSKKLVEQYPDSPYAQKNR